MINKMKEIKNLLEIIIENNYEKIIQDSINIYFEQYIFQIKKLIDEFPIDHTNEDGSLFWSGSKRFPNIIDFNIEDQDCINFIKYYSILLSRSIKVRMIDDNSIKTIVQKMKIPEYIPQTNKIPSREEELEEINILKTF